MKWSLIAALLFIISLSSCEIERNDARPVQESTYVPVLMDKDQLRESIAYKPGIGLKNPGKFYLYQDYLFINEKYQGVHIIDNSEPEHPMDIGFIQIPGCVDIAVKGTQLYADNAIDLVAIDISAFPEIKVTKRLESVLPEPSPPDGLEVPYEFREENRPENTVIVNWKKNPENDAL